jgi:predicted RNA binding protein YcfA (HicA-like mRNA interferase family)
MAKRPIKEKEIIAYLEENGFKEVKAKEKSATWYKKASKHPSCLKTAGKKYCH